MSKYTTSELTKMWVKSIIIIVVCAIVVGLGFGLFAKHRQTTIYTASRNVVISHSLNERPISSADDNNSGQSVVFNDMNMMKTYKQIANNRQVTDSAWNMLDHHMKQNYDRNAVNSAVSASTHDQSLVLTLSVQTKSAKASAAIANAESRALRKELPKIQTGAGTVHLLSKATSHNVTSETKPHAKKYAALGVALGGLIGIIISFLDITLKDLRRSQK